MRRLRSLADRFWAKVDISQEPGGCWLWTGKPDHHGYGKISQKRGEKQQHFYAHRVSWELHNGPIPEGQEVLHRCDNPPCVNPNHLFLGTQLDNMHDMVEKRRDRNPATANRQKTHCKRGHELTPANVYRGRRGRCCITCHRDRARKQKQGRRWTPFHIRGLVFVCACTEKRGCPGCKLKLPIGDWFVTDLRRKLIKRTGEADILSADLHLSHRVIAERVPRLLKRVRQLKSELVA